MHVEDPAPEDGKRASWGKGPDKAEEAKDIKFQRMRAAYYGNVGEGKHDESDWSTQRRGWRKAGHI